MNTSRILFYVVAVGSAAWVALAEMPAQVVLLVTKETATEVTDDGTTVVTNVTDRYVFNTLPALPQVSYRSALEGYATNTPSATISNDIAREVAGFYARIGQSVTNVEVRLP